MQAKHIVAALVALLAAGPAFADDAKIQELDRKLNVLTREIERLKLGSADEPDELKPMLGFGPAAAKIYQKGVKRVSVGGYGELAYKNRHRSERGAVSSGDTIDMVRTVLYIGYKFNDWITFNSEIEYEHANTAKRGEVGVELAQIDFRFHNAIGARAGLLLMPFGLTNEVHEPTTFHGVNRPSVESSIVPTTWRENGAGVFGEVGPVSYRSYLVSGLQGAGDANVSGFSAGSLFRGARDKGSVSRIEDPAWITRVDVSPVPGASIGGSYYVGEADQDMLFSAVPVNMWEIHAQGQYRGFEANALYVDGHIGGVDALNIHQGNAVGGTGSVGTDFFGGYLTLAYDVLSLVPATDHYLAPFFRYERYDTQQKVPGAWSKNPANSRLEWTMGLTYKPTPQVVVKFDHQIKKNQAVTGVGQTNLGVGYIF